MSKRSSRTEKTSKSSSSSSSPSFISPSGKIKPDQKNTLLASHSEGEPLDNSSSSSTSPPITSTQQIAAASTVEIVEPETATNHIAAAENHNGNCNSNNSNQSSFSTAAPNYPPQVSETCPTDMPASALELVDGADSTTAAESRPPPASTEVLTNGHLNGEDVQRQTPPARDYEAVQPAKSPVSPSQSPSPTTSATLSQRCLSPAMTSPARHASPSPRHRTRTISSTSSCSGEVSVPMFFTGKGVLVTGATGFIGKVLIEKLLRCCPDLACVYCLIRPKNKQAIETRLKDITSSKVRHSLYTRIAEHL
ncbi:fatty acyl-CoA reductase [Elysia marginata]|uniref:Fatty acyl-CoA reductase n=1 Tax=Elysia marginata TaxID=1093978 RepID=A0AAV4IA06_9GAST|nr:fatty acyl-CoA reductase [Elysia marginata]